MLYLNKNPLVSLLIRIRRKVSYLTFRYLYDHKLDEYSMWERVRDKSLTEFRDEILFPHRCLYISRDDLHLCRSFYLEDPDWYFSGENEYRFSEDIARIIYCWAIHNLHPAIEYVYRRRGSKTLQFFTVVQMEDGYVPCYGSLFSYRYPTIDEALWAVATSDGQTDRGFRVAVYLSQETPI